MTVGKAKENVIQSRQSEKKRLEINNKERLKNNILIKIEFFDIGGVWANFALGSNSVKGKARPNISCEGIQTSEDDQPRNG